MDIFISSELIVLFRLFISYLHYDISYISSYLSLK